MSTHPNGKSIYGRPPLSTQQDPWLLICHGKDVQKQTFYSISNDRYEVKTIPALKNTTILACTHDWLVLLDRDSEDCYIWNPLSMDKIQIPPLPDDDIADYNYKCLLSDDGPERRLLIIEEDEPLTLYFCRPNHDQEFHRQELQNIVHHNFKCLTVFKGKFYGLTFPGSNLIVLDIDYDSGIVQATPLTDQPPVYDDGNFCDMPASVSYLLQSYDGDLLHIKCVRFGIRFEESYTFQIYRFDFVKKSWVKVISIGESAIFLDNFRGISCSTKGTNLKRESIYFTSNDRCLYIFNLETQSISVTLPCPHVSRKTSQFCWLKLSPNNS